MRVVVCCVMHFGLTSRQRKWLHITTVASTIASWGLLHLRDLLPPWLFYTVVSTAFVSGLASVVLRRSLNVEGNVASVTMQPGHMEVKYHRAGGIDMIADSRMEVQLIEGGRLEVVLADVRDIRLLSPSASRINNVFARTQQHIVRIGYRDRKRRVLYAQLDLQTSAVWIPDLIEYLLATLDVPWFVDGKRCDDHATIRAWVQQSRPSKPTVDPRASVFSNTSNSL